MSNDPEATNPADPVRVRSASGVSRRTRGGADDDGTRVVSMVVAGPLVYGGIGWALDHFWLQTGVLLVVGLLVGIALSIVMIIYRYRAQS